MTNVTEVIPAADWGRVQAEAKKQSRSKKLHQKFYDAVRARRLPEPRWHGHPQKELRFAAHMKVPRQKVMKSDRNPSWRFDFAWPEFKIAVEVEGLVCRELHDKDGGSHWVAMGGHATMDGFRDDCEKYAWANFLGWAVLRFEQNQVGNGFAIDMTVRMLYARGWKP